MYSMFIEDFATTLNVSLYILMFHVMSFLNNQFHCFIFFFSVLRRQESHGRERRRSFIYFF